MLNGEYTVHDVGKDRSCLLSLMSIIISIINSITIVSSHNRKPKKKLIIIRRREYNHYHKKRGLGRKSAPDSLRLHLLLCFVYRTKLGSTQKVSWHQDVSLSLPSFLGLIHYRTSRVCLIMNTPQEYLQHDSRFWTNAWGYFGGLIS